MMIVQELTQEEVELILLCMVLSEHRLSPKELELFFELSDKLRSYLEYPDYEPR